MAKKSGSVKGLGAMTREPVSQTEIGLLVDDMMASNDRITAIIGGAVIEGQLEGVLKRVLLKQSAGNEAKLFGSNGPLSTFANKNNLAHAMKLITREVYRDIDHIRLIRNAFAHAPRPLRFATPEVEAVCRLLSARKANGEPYVDARRQFLGTFMAVGRTLSNTADNDAKHGADLLAFALNDAPDVRLVPGSIKPISIEMAVKDRTSLVRGHVLWTPPREAVLKANLTKEEAISLIVGLRKVAKELSWHVPTDGS